MEKNNREYLKNDHPQKGSKAFWDPCTDFLSFLFTSCQTEMNHPAAGPTEKGTWCFQSGLKDGNVFLIGLIPAALPSDPTHTREPSCRAGSVPRWVWYSVMLPNDTRHNCRQSYTSVTPLCPPPTLLFPSPPSAFHALGELGKSASSQMDVLP